MAPAAFWRAWWIWVVSVAAYAAAAGYNAIHPLPAKLASDVGSAADGVTPVDLDAVRDDLARVVHQALEPAHVSLWISQRD